MSEVMSFAQKIAARNKAALGAVTGSGPLTVVAAPAPVQAPVQAPAPAATATGTPGPVVRAPWANVTCPACKGLGFNTAGTPCPICDIKTKQTGIPKSSDYDLTPMGDGSVYWVLKADRNKEGVSPMVANGAVPVVAETRVQAPAPVAPAPAPVEAPAPAGVPVIAGTPITPAVAPAEVPATPTPATRGRQKARFTLLLNVVASKGEKATTRLYDVFLDAQKTMAQASGKESFYDLDPFQRRDEFLRAGEAIAEKLGNDDVTADLASASPDFKAFIEAVRPYCDREFIAA